MDEMANIEVDYDELVNGKRQLIGHKQEISAKVKELLQQINQLTMERGFTTDVASTQYNQAFAEWTQGIQGAAEGMDEMARYLDGVMQKYQALDQTSIYGG
jgi:uncharacterized protein YukE